MLPYTLQDQIGFKIFVELQCKTQLFNSGGMVKWAYFQKKWSIPLNLKSI